MRCRACAPPASAWPFPPGDQSCRAGGASPTAGTSPGTIGPVGSGGHALSGLLQGRSSGPGFDRTSGSRGGGGSRGTG